MSTDSWSAIDKLKAFSTCDICDALLKLKMPRGGFISGPTMWSPQRQDGTTRIIGPAYTVKFVRDEDTEAPVLDGHYIDDVPKGSVVFISMPSGVEHAAYGGLVTRRARYQEAIGTVVDGNIRDVEEQRELGFPVFAHNLCPVPYFEVTRPSQINVPLQLRDRVTTIEPGDIVIADLNGVIYIPQSLLSEVVDLVPRLAESTVQVGVDIDRGSTFSDAAKRHRR